MRFKHSLPFQDSSLYGVPFNSSQAPVNLFLRLFENDALTQGWVKLRKFYLTFNLLFILTGPNNVFGLRGLEPE